MTKLIALFSFVLFISFPAWGQQTGISPALTTEGDFSIRLAFVLGLVNTNNAVEAEDKLSDAGIAPSNGWMEQFPLTPNTITEMSDAVCSSAQNGNLPTYSACIDAQNAYLQVVGEFDGALGNPTSNAPPPPPPDQSDLDSYYTNAGMPIVTYYVPPTLYIGFYAWYPFPFFYGGYMWSGYWIMRDFHRFVYYHGHRIFMSNHYMGHDGRVIILDPARRGYWPTHGIVVHGRGALPHVVPNHGGGHIGGGHIGGGHVGGHGHR